MEWIKALRLKTALIGVLVYVTAESLINWKGFSWYVVLFILTLSIATMAGNDWDDRFIDAHTSKKTFAYSKGRKYRLFKAILWVLPLLVTARMMFALPFYYYAFSVGFYLACLYYVFIRRLKFVPAIYVAVVSSCPIVYAFFEAQENKFSLALFWVFILLVMYAQEHINDLIDLKFDQDTKWTFPVIFGEDRTRVLVAILLLIALAIYCALDPLALIFAVVGWWPFTAYFFYRKWYLQSKIWFDLTIILLLVFLIF